MNEARFRCWGKWRMSEFKRTNKSWIFSSFCGDRLFLLHWDSKSAHKTLHSSPFISSNANEAIRKMRKMERKLCKLLFASSSISQFLSFSLERDWEALRSHDRHARRDFFSRFSAIHSVELCIQSIVIINSIWIGTSKIKSLWWWRWKLRWIVWNCTESRKNEKRLNDEVKIAMSFPRWRFFSYLVCTR